MTKQFFQYFLTFDHCGKQWTDTHKTTSLQPVACPVCSIPVQSSHYALVRYTQDVVPSPIWYPTISQDNCEYVSSAKPVTV